MKNVVEKLEKRGLKLPEPPKPGGAYESVRIIADIAYVSAQFPFASDGTPAFQGRIGKELSTEDGCRAAELCALNVLAQIHRHVSFRRLLGLNRIEAYLVTADGWDEFPRVVDGASELFLHALGPDAGRHARALVGVARLPMNVPIEITATFALKPVARSDD